MTQTVAPPTEQYTSVRTLIEKVKAGKLGKPAQAQPMIAVGQRVEVCIDGVPQLGMVKEVNTVTGYARIEGEQAWMHSWLPVAEIHPAPELYPVGTRIFCAFLGMEATVIATTQTRIRVEWNEPLIKGHPIRRGWLFREDCELVAEQEKAADL